MKVKIAICQVKVLHKKGLNLKKASAMIKESAKNGAEIIILPEMFNCPYYNKYFPIFAEYYPGESTQLLSSLARELSVYIVGGSIPEKENGNIYNTSYTFNRSGNLIGRHRKIHLFDVDIRNSITFKESDTITAGKNITVFDTEFCKIGLAICYDMRFPELIRKMTLQGAKIIIIPAAFNMTTGPAHWHLTSRSRALDNQIYFIGASPARNRKAEYIAYGHSLVVDPWGTITAEAGSGEQILYGNIDLDSIDKVRNQLPLLKHRREDIY